MEVSFRQTVTDHVILFKDTTWAVKRLRSYMTPEQVSSGKSVLKNLIPGSVNADSIELSLRALGDYVKIKRGEETSAWDRLHHHGNRLVGMIRAERNPSVRDNFVREAVAVLMIMVAMRVDVERQAKQKSPRKGPRSLPEGPSLWD